MCFRLQVRPETLTKKHIQGRTSTLFCVKMALSAPGTILQKRGLLSRVKQINPLPLQEVPR
ncbi:wsv017 [White spot syndrome virus]|uniref:Wsv017 n=1 Tax=White spot syndrome virus TaxID=342409 RepID=K7WW68_9VIRU|nr:wsv017 [White spot syndrome virus]